MDVPKICRHPLCLTSRELRSFLPFSRRALVRMVSKGEFPHAVKLSNGIEARRVDEFLRRLNDRNGAAS